jgi:hypothetical protein
MADKCLLDYAAHQAGLAYIKGIVFRWLLRASALYLG